MLYKSESRSPPPPPKVIGGNYGFWLTLFSLMELWFVVATFQFAKDFQAPVSWTLPPPFQLLVHFISHHSFSTFCHLSDGY